jgi:hypothetical protein
MAMGILVRTKGLLALLLMGVTVTTVSAQQLEEDPVLQQLQQPAAVTRPNPERKILKGNIVSLDAAILEEKGTVDWYGWYMACRQYLIRAGGLNCRIGTMIRFDRSGMMTALSSDLPCVYSVSQKRFALPPNTAVEGIILPVRSGRAQPATPEELHRYLQGG